MCKARNSYYKRPTHSKILRPQAGNPPIRLSNGDWARNDENKAEAFAYHLEDIFQINEIDTEFLL